MKYLQLVKMCERYITAITNDATNLVENYSKVMNFLDSKLRNNDDDLSVILEATVINETLKVVSRKNINLKSISTEWDSEAVQKCYKLLNNIKKAIDADDEDMWRINLNRLYTLIEFQPSRYTQLYMWKCYKDTSMGLRFFVGRSEQFKALNNLKTEDELAECLALVKEGKVEEKEDKRLGVFAEEDDFTILDLLNKFNPNGKSECEEMLEELEKMKFNGQLTFESYSYAKNIILEPWLGYFTRNGDGRPNGGGGKLFEVIDGEKFMKEEQNLEVVTSSGE